MAQWATSLFLSLSLHPSLSLCRAYPLFTPPVVHPPPLWNTSSLLLFLSPRVDDVTDEEQRHRPGLTCGRERARIKDVMEERH